MKGKIIHCESINPYPLLESPRINYIYERIVSVLNSFLDIEFIGFERQVRQQRYNHNAKYILDIAEGFGAFKLACHQLSLIRDIQVYQFTAQDLKLYATGKGNATKEDMINSLPVRLLNKVKSSTIPEAIDDVVDAYYAAKRTLSILAESEEIRKDYIYLRTKEVILNYE